MNEKYERLIRELTEESHVCVNCGGDISWTIKFAINELSKEDFLEVLKGVAAKFIEREIKGSV